MPLADSQDNPLDLLGTRLVQTRAVLDVLISSHSKQFGFAGNDDSVVDTIWAAKELLGQAKDALDLVWDEKKENATNGERS